MKQERTDLAIYVSCGRTDTDTQIELTEEPLVSSMQCFDKVDPGKLTVDSHFLNDLGLDSLDHVEVIMMMEEEFMFEFPDDDWERLYTPAAITQYVADRFDVFH